VRQPSPHVNESLRQNYMRRVVDPAVLTALRNLAIEGETRVKASMKRLGKRRTVKIAGRKRIKFLRSQARQTKRALLKTSTAATGHITAQWERLTERLQGIEFELALRKGTRKLARAIGGRSAPGEPPAIQTGHLFRNITHEVDPKTLTARFGSNVIYDKYLEFGTRKMPARPHYRPVVKQLDIPAGFRAAFATAGGG